jgi:hypothetical protein
VAVGGVGSARWRLALAWTLAFDLAVEATILGEPFYVVGVPGAVLTPHRIQAAGLLGLARSFGF